MHSRAWSVRVASCVRYSCTTHAVYLVHILCQGLWESCPFKVYAGAIVAHALLAQLELVFGHAFATLDALLVDLAPDRPLFRACARPACQQPRTGAHHTTHGRQRV